MMCHQRFVVSHFFSAEQYWIFYQIIVYICHHIATKIAFLGMVIHIKVNSKKYKRCTYIQISPRLTILVSFQAILCLNCNRKIRIRTGSKSTIHYQMYNCHVKIKVCPVELFVLSGHLALIQVYLIFKKVNSFYFYLIKTKTHKLLLIVIYQQYVHILFFWNKKLKVSSNLFLIFQ